MNIIRLNGVAVTLIAVVGFLVEVLAGFVTNGLYLLGMLTYGLWVAEQEGYFTRENGPPHQLPNLAAYMFLLGALVALSPHLMLDPEYPTAMKIIWPGVGFTMAYIFYVHADLFLKVAQDTASYFIKDTVVEDEMLVKWINNHTPSLQPRAKEEYIKAAQFIVDTYYQERLSPTDNELIAKRREREEIKSLADVQVEMFERYKKLVQDSPEPDGFIPFPFYPPHKRWFIALNNLVNDAWFLPWEYEIEKSKDDYVEGERVARTPFVHVAEKLNRASSGKKRFESTFILAPSGSGKSTVLNYLINNDFDYIALDEMGNAPYAPSIIAMDSTGDFLKNLTAKRHFHPETGIYNNRLVVIEPDAEKPLALNPFAFGRQRIQSAKGNEKVKLNNQVIDLLTHIFSSVGENTAFTPRQRLAFGHVVRLCMVIPNSTLQTLHDIMATASIEPYKQHLDELSDEAQAFFNTTFPNLKKVYQEELLWRVQLVLENEAFAPMVKAPDCKVDFYELLNAGSVIAIYCNRNLLGSDGAVAVFGRLMVALIRMAMKERDAIPEEKRKPAYFYIDELHEYLDNDEQVAVMIDDVRKSRLALIMATQRLSKITDTNVRDALLSSGTLLAKPHAVDAKSVATYMHTHHTNIEDLPDYVFALYARGVSDQIRVAIPNFHPQWDLSKSEQAETIKRNKERYGYTPTSVSKPATPAPRENKPVKRL